MAKRAFQKELDKLIEQNEKAGVRPCLLLHSCCAPCSSYVLEYLEKHFDITIYYYNPNIDSEEEYERRVSELRSFIKRSGSSAELIAGRYEPERFYEIARGHEKDPERGERCKLCYELRLRETARLLLKLKEEGKRFDFFCTTLTLSPLKDAAALNDIGEAVASELGIGYLPSDFKKRDGYKRSIELSKIYGLYRQDYCGCVFSRAEKERRDALKTQID